MIDEDISCAVCGALVDSAAMCVEDMSHDSGWRICGDCVASTSPCLCDVCHNRCHDGTIEHGRGCYVVSEDGGGASSCDCNTCLRCGGTGLRRAPGVAKGTHVVPEQDPPRLDERFDAQDVRELAAVRDNMGWNPGTWEKLPIRLMCIISELEELENAMKTGRRDHINEELADVAAYITLLLYDIFPPWCGEDRSDAYDRTTPYESPEVLCGPIRAAVVCAMQNWRRPELGATGIRRVQRVQEDLEHALYKSFCLANTIGTHLPTAMRAKMTVLRGREPRNGGKHPDT